VNYTEKIKDGFSSVKETDVCVICGDLSWGMTLEEAKEDFIFIDRLPGKKIILKGNHDYWWTTAAKAYQLFAENGITTISILNNNCYLYGDIAICGTRGWFYEEEKGLAHDRKIMLRELIRLETSLKCGGNRVKLAFLHYPPKYLDYECPEILDLFEKYNVPLCCYGHLHSQGCSAAFIGEHRGTRFRLVSGDYLNSVR
jgi:predicted phosphohydrolase